MSSACAPLGSLGILPSRVRLATAIADVMMTYLLSGLRTSICTSRMRAPRTGLRMNSRPIDDAAVLQGKPGSGQDRQCTPACLPKVARRSASMSLPTRTHGRHGGPARWAIMFGASWVVGFESGTRHYRANCSGNTAPCVRSTPTLYWYTIFPPSRAGMVTATSPKTAVTRRAVRDFFL